VRERGRLLDPGGLEAAHHALGLIARRRGDLARDQAPVDQRDEVGERPPDVDSEARPAVHRASLSKTLARALSERRRAQFRIAHFWLWSGVPERPACPTSHMKIEHKKDTLFATGEGG
jgi:hypothetical protein